ncbi:MAG: energy-coupling factor ABC transporter substrate-binding protein, partial [Desulfocucumaceae bacterium]
MKGNLLYKNLMLAIIVLGLIIIPFVINRGGEFAGTDGEAEKAIAEVSPGYEPWYKPIWEPPGSEVESLLFAAQAAIGSGFIGDYFGDPR